MRRDTNFDHARDELFAHIHRCEVLQAAEGQAEWMDDTVEYLAERYPTLSQEQLDELRTMGIRFCQPVIPHGKDHSALTVADEAVEEETEQLSGVA